MDKTINAATDGGGEIVASFGSGDSGGRLQAKAGNGNARRSNASAAEVRSLKGRINRQGVTGNSAAAKKRKALLKEIDDNSKSNGKISRGILADIASDLADL